MQGHDADSGKSLLLPSTVNDRCKKKKHQKKTPKKTPKKTQTE
jgi:hypothetical protein